MKLMWEPNLELSAIHTAWCVNALPASCGHLDSGLVEASRDFFSCSEISKLSTKEVEWRRFLTRLVAPTVIPQDRISEDASAPTTLPAVVAARVQQLTQQFSRLTPNFAQELQLRLSPLQQHWEAVGPGLLGQFHSLTGIPRTELEPRVFLLQPVLGGYGIPHAGTECIQLEAVLANEDPRLPETLRLSWLIGRIAWESEYLKRGELSEQLCSQIAITSIFPTLMAASELGLSMLAAPVFEAALRNWMPLQASSAGRPSFEDASERWESYLESGRLAESGHSK